VLPSRVVPGQLHHRRLEIRGDGLAHKARNCRAGVNFAEEIDAAARVGRGIRFPLLDGQFVFLEVVPKRCEGKRDIFHRLFRGPRRRRARDRDHCLAQLVAQGGVAPQDRALEQSPRNRGRNRGHANLARRAFDDRTIPVDRCIARKGLADRRLLTAGKPVRQAPEQPVQLARVFRPHPFDFRGIEIFDTGRRQPNFVAPDAIVDPAANQALQLGPGR
jgi:hypothetical protein